MMPMNEETLMGRLEELASFASRTEARQAFDSVLQALRRGMSEDEADWLAVALGPALSAALLRESYAGELDERELYRWTKRNGKQRKAVAVERARVVCQALGELLPQAELERLERHLPDLATLFRASDTPRHPHSLAHLREPHNDTKLPSSPGIGREGRSLASAGQSRH
jgi:uncharacterized protein (DUF2267 family)